MKDSKKKFKTGERPNSKLSVVLKKSKLGNKGDVLPFSKDVKPDNMEVSTEWTVPKKTAKNWVSKPKKAKAPVPSELVTGQVTNNQNAPRLYIRYPKSLEALNLNRNKLLMLHPEITDIRIPRKKLHSRWFLAVFKTEEKALAAKEEIQAKGDCQVMIQFSKESREKRKNSKADKQSLIRDWTLEKMDEED